jgi:hypothetical protein
MPIWAIGYCVMIVLSCVFALTLYKTRPSYYVPGQILSSICSVLIFVLYYEVFWLRPQSASLILAMIGFTLYWELWENRFLFPKVLRPGEVASELGSPFSGEPFQVSPKAYICFWAVVSVIALPMFFIMAQLMLSYR